jgi:hypothetical protein
MNLQELIDSVRTMTGPDAHSFLVDCGVHSAVIKAILALFPEKLTLDSPLEMG